MLNPTSLSRRGFLLTAAMLAAAGCIRTGPSGQLRIGGGEKGGLYLTFAELLARQFTAQHPDAHAEAVPTEGSVDNVRRLRAGTVDMGLVLADVAEKDGTIGPPDTAPLAVARVYENYLQVIVRDRDPIQRLTDLAGRRISIGPGGSGAAATSEVLLASTGLTTLVDAVKYRLGDGLAGLADGSLDAVVWSGGVPTPAISNLDAKVSLRMLDIGQLAGPMTEYSGYPYLVRRVPTGSYVPRGLTSIGVPNLLLCRSGIADDVVAAVVDVLAAQAPQLVPPFVRGLQYLDPATMIQTGLIGLHPAATEKYQLLHG